MATLERETWKRNVWSHVARGPVTTDATVPAAALPEGKWGVRIELADTGRATYTLTLSREEWTCMVEAWEAYLQMEEASTAEE